MAKIVVALGGNALGNSPQEQKEIVKNTAKAMVDIIANGDKLIIVHGNGPQVGMINNAFDLAHKAELKVPSMPFPECGAMSQGYIGYHLQNAIGNELLERKINKKIVTLVTQIVVDKDDQGFINPSKPIGSFYDEKTAKLLSKENNWIIKEDAGRGFRRVIASPKPIDILEKEVINNLVENEFIVICAGGGGIPVIKTHDGYQGVDAVIDKDFASEKLAELIQADKLMILTAVPKVAINFNKKNQKFIDKMTITEANKFILENQFAAGSMLPKVQAAIKFVEYKTSNVSTIAELSDVKKALNGEAGTIIIH